MKKIFLLLMIIVFSVSQARAQFWKMRKLELSAGPGMTQFFGDIGGFTIGKNLLGLKDISFRQTRFNLNMNVRYRIRDDISARLNLTYGAFHPTDVRGSNENRGYEATTRFFEYATIGEFYFIRNKAENSFIVQKGRKLPFKSILSLFDCYAFTGFGLLSYNVTPNDILSATSAETKGLAPVIPIGAGVNFNYSPDFSFGAELAARYAFSDNLDGYTSQYSKRNDMYYFFNLSVIYKMKTSKKRF